MLSFSPTPPHAYHSKCASRENTDSEGRNYFGQLQGFGHFCDSCSYKARHATMCCVLKEGLKLLKPRGFRSLGFSFRALHSEDHWLLSHLRGRAFLQVPAYRRPQMPGVSWLGTQVVPFSQYLFKVSLFKLNIRKKGTLTLKGLLGNLHKLSPAWNHHLEMRSQALIGQALQLNSNP